jgi:type II secretory pathway pseudopilin PulG
LIELVIAMLILALISTAGVPKIVAHQDKWRLQSAARHLAHDLRQTAKYALARSESFSMQFDLTLDRYTLPTVIDPAHPGQTYSVSLRDLYGVDLTSTTLVGTPPTFTWSGYGSPVAAGSITLQRNGQQAIVTITAQGEVQSP